MSLFLIACSSGGNEPTGEEEKPDDTPIVVEDLPNGVTVGEETVQLNNIQLQEVVGVDEDNSTLTFDASLPEEQIPQKGQIILQFSPTDELPYGFLGRVTNVKKSGDKIIVETEVPALNEAFEEFSINYDSRSAYMSSRADDDAEIENEITVDQDGYINFTTTVSQEDPNISCSISFGLNTSINVNIDNDKNINDQLFGFGIKTSSNITYSEKTEAEVKHRSDIGKGVKFTIPNLSPAVTGAVQFFWASEAKGEVEFSTTLSSSINDVYYVESRSGGIPTITKKANNNNPSVDVKLEPELKLKGEMFMGLGTRVDLRLFGRKELSVGIGAEVGPEVSAEIDLLGDPANLYSEYKDSCVALQGVLKTKAYANAKLFGAEKEWDKELLPIRWELAQRYIFPEFKNISLDDSENAYCEATLERDVLFPMGIGFSQYNENNKLVKHSDAIQYYNAKDFGNPLTAEFSHKENYSYWTYVKLGNQYVKCKKANAFSIIGKWNILKDEHYEEQPGSLSTGELKGCEYINGQYHAYGYNGGGKEKYDRFLPPGDMWTFEFCENGTLIESYYDVYGDEFVFIEGYEINDNIIHIIDYSSVDPENPNDKPDEYNYQMEIIDKNNIILYWEKKSSYYFGYQKYILQRRI